MPIKLEDTNVDTEKVEKIRDDLLKIFNLNKRIIRIIKEISKDAVDLKERLADIKSLEEKEKEKIEEGQEKIGLEHLEAKLKELENEEQISDKLIETLIQTVDYELEQLSEFKKFLSTTKEGTDLSKKLTENRKFLSELLNGKRQIEDEEDLEDTLKFITQLTKLLRDHFENENILFERIEKIEESMKPHVSRLKLLSANINELLAGLKHEEEESFKHARDLRILVRNEFTVKELLKIMNAALKFTEKADEEERKNMYMKISNEFRQKRKVLKFKFNNLDIRFRIISIELTRVLLIQLDKKGIEIGMLFIKHRGVLGRLFQEKQFTEFREEKDGLENGLKYRLGEIRVSLLRSIKTDPDHAKELANIAINEMGILTKENIEKTLEIPSDKELKELKAKITQEKFKEVFLQPGDAGGEKGFIKYARTVLSEILEHRKKYHIETRTGKALAELYEKARHNIGVFMEVYLKERKYGKEDLDRVHDEIFKDFPLH